MSETTRSAPPTRAAAIQWARDLVAAASAVVIDTETTGLGPDAEIVDIAVVGLDGTVYLDTLVRPKRPIPPGATAVHGITDGLVADAEPWELVYGRFAESLTNIVLVYNLGYDLPIINQVSRAAMLPEFESDDEFCRWQCAMLAYSDFDGTPGKYRGQMKWHNLDVAATRFNIPPGGHRALADTKTTRRVVLAMAHSPLDGESGEFACWRCNGPLLYETSVCSCIRAIVDRPMGPELDERLEGIATTLPFI